MNCIAFVAIKSKKPASTFCGGVLLFAARSPHQASTDMDKTQNQGNDWHLQDEPLLSLWTEVLNLVALPLLLSIHPMFIMNLDLRRLLQADPSNTRQDLQLLLRLILQVR
jgi:hypothetical protein